MNFRPLSNFQPPKCGITNHHQNEITPGGFGHVDSEEMHREALLNLGWSVLFNERVACSSEGDSSFAEGTVCGVRWLTSVSRGMRSVRVRVGGGVRCGHEVFRLKSVFLIRSVANPAHPESTTHAPNIASRLIPSAFLQDPSTAEDCAARVCVCMCVCV